MNRNINGSSTSATKRKTQKIEVQMGYQSIGNRLPLDIIHSKHNFHTKGYGDIKRDVNGEKV